MFKIIELDKIVSGKNIRNERDEEINDLAKSIEEKENNRCYGGDTMGLTLKQFEEWVKSVKEIA